MSPITAVISDFGGVLTSPLLDAFMAFQKGSGVPLEALGAAMAAIATRDGANPLFELETGRLTEAAFLGSLATELSDRLGQEIHMDGFGQGLFEHLHPNTELVDYMRELRARGYGMAICTNNVREWEPLWRAKLPVDEIFDVVVDSAFVGMRKPDRGIYELTLERLGVEPEAAVLIDDVDVNCAAARTFGMTAVQFESNAQVKREIEAALAAA